MSPCHHGEMPQLRVDRTDLSVFSLVDVDTPEAHAFTIYLAYWEAFAGIVIELYPEPARLLAELQGRKRYRSLSSSQFGGGRRTRPGPVLVCGCLVATNALSLQSHGVFWDHQIRYDL
jgi:hypothetical protein